MTIMALVQRRSTAQPCRRLRPRGRQRLAANGVCGAAAALLTLLTVFQLVGQISTGQVVKPTPVSVSQTLPTPQLLAKDSATPSWRRMGLSEAVTNNEQELINKILRDDTSSSEPSSFQYTLVPAASVVTPLPSMSPAAVTKTDTDRLPVPQSSATAAEATAAAAGESLQTTGNGKINQSRTKEEQEAFNKRFGGQNSSVNSQRRRRRAVNVVVKTSASEEQGRGSSSGSDVHSENSNFFLLKSIVTGIERCFKDQCRHKFHGLSSSDNPQMLRLLSQSNSSDGGSSGKGDEGGDKKYSNVNVLNLSDSGLRTLPHRTMQAIAGKLPNIEFIDLSINQLKSASFALSGPLAFLNFSQNQLTRFHLQNGTLAQLDLSNNNLTATTRDGDYGPPSIVLGTEHCANLTMLDLSHNHLSDLSFLRQSPGRVVVSCPVRVLNLAYNQLHSIQPDTFANTPHLEILSLAHNSLEEIGNDTFAHLQSLQYLDLGDNLLNASSIRALQGIPDLIGLSLARNPKLGDALQGFVASWSLKELDISETGLCEVPAALAQSVRTLNLAHNHFQVIRSGDLDSYPLLFSLNLDHCGIAEIEDDALGRLEMLATLNLNHNNLRQVPISLPENLMALHIEDNHIMELQANRFAHLTNLKVLSLSGNKIQYLPALPLRKLLVLNLVSAELHGLSQLVVQTSPHLKDLRLDNNPVKCADLLGIAEWATPCRDFAIGETTATTSTDYHDLDDDELRELAEEMDKNSLKYLLDFVASKGRGARDEEEERRSRQLSMSSHKAHLCRSSPTTAAAPTRPTPPPPPQVAFNATKSSPATLLRNKSPQEDAERETDIGETEQITSNLPNPRSRQPVTTPPSTIIKTLPLRSTPFPAKTSGKGADRQRAILPHRHNNGSLQITGHLNSNKRSDGVDDGATNARAREATATPSTNANEVLAAAAPEDTDTNSKSYAPSLFSAQLPSQNETAAGAGKSSESDAIKLTNNKNANPDGAAGSAVLPGGVGAHDDRSKKSVDRVNNKKLIKLTDSSNNRKLMPFIGQTGQRRRISNDGVFAQQSISSSSTASTLVESSSSPPLLATTSTQNKNVETTEIPLASSSMATSTTWVNSHVTSSPSDIPSATTTAAAALSHQLPLITTSPAVAVVAAKESLPISSKQIIFQRRSGQEQQHPQITQTRDDVHNLLSEHDGKSSSFANVPTLTTPPSGEKPTKMMTTTWPTATEVASAGKVVNETWATRKNLPKTVAIPSQSSFAADVAKPRPLPPPVILRKDDDNASASMDGNENGKLMRNAQSRPTQAAASDSLSTGGLIEDTSSEDDNDNPLLELWQQSRTHLSTASRRTTISLTSTITDEAVAPEAALSVSTSNTRSDDAADVNESKNLIRTKSREQNKNGTMARSHAAVLAGDAETPPSLKSETILINDRNNDATRDESHQDNSASGILGLTENEDFVLKLISEQQQQKERQVQEKENSKIYVAENSLSVAQLVLPTTTTAAKDHPLSHSRDSRNNAGSDSPGDETNRRRPDKLSQLDTNSIHEGDTAAGGQVGVGALSGGAGGPSRPTPWNEHIKDDGRRNEDAGEDNRDEMVANSNNYHHRQPHPGLFIVIGATIGIVLSIGLFRCKQSWWTQRHYPLPDSGDINQTYTKRQFDYNNNSSSHQDRMATRPSWDMARDTSSTYAAASSSSSTDNFNAHQHGFDGSDDDYYRCTSWRDRAAADTGKCDEQDFVDVQLTPRSERKSVKFDLLPMKILSPSDQQPFLLHPIMTSDCDYAPAAAIQQNNNNNGGGGCDMGAAGSADRSNKSSSPLELW